MRYSAPLSKCAKVDPTDDSYLSVAMQSVLLVKFAAASNNCSVSVCFRHDETPKLVRILRVLNP